ncbi:DNA-binding protein RFXANK-like isoform X2 [Anoplophora glabripennis]|uniref:DNA-binding protein RFXANK-like isoform X2 n=1 Tax=Anoplophora glabripennis TaxID=217634 RepID=UPI000C764BD8|nr:DNA-binding protein RFXANK-like isoform X2 [Anoplophora glabripennis]
MEHDQEDSSNEEKDVKPIIFPNPTTKSPETIGLSPSLVSGPKKWSPRLLQDGNRKSAFLPYKHTYTCNTVLTNLQRGNTQAETPVPQSTEINFHMKAGQGELTEQDILQEDDVDICDKNNLTALHWASAYGQYSTVQLLLKHGASVNKLGPEEESPLILAASGGHHEVVRLLINSKAEVNHVDHLCNTALMYAARGNHPHTCQELLSHGADFSFVNLNDDTAHVIAVDNSSTLAQTVIENFIIARMEATGESS